MQIYITAFDAHFGRVLQEEKTQEKFEIPHFFSKRSRMVHLSIICWGWSPNKIAQQMSFLASARTYM